MRQKTKIKTPGKLMIAGEYAVLAPYQPLIVTAVNRFITVTIEDDEKNQLSLLDYDLHQLEWDFVNEKTIINASDEHLNFAKAAMTLAFQYLQHKGYATSACHIQIKSDLVDTTGLKYGLGSSAAVVVAVIEGLLTHYTHQKLNRMIVFKLAAMAHVLVQKNGSGADVAASTFGGLIKYTSFQAEWLLARLQSNPTMNVLGMDWTYLSIEPCTLPKDIVMYVGWTGAAASTKELVTKIQQAKSSHLEIYDAFLTESKQAVEMIVAGINQNDHMQLFAGIEKNRKILSHLGRILKVPVETEKLFLLSQAARELKGAGKLSGAGGGDCGIAFLDVNVSSERIFSKWEALGIKPLALTIYP